jgi:hypothetical protein
MTDQLIIEPEARLLVELGQERGVVYEDELAGLSLELDLDADDVQALRDELTQLGVDIVDPPAPEERIEVVEVEFERQAHELVLVHDSALLSKLDKEPGFRLDDELVSHRSSTPRFLVPQPRRVPTFAMQRVFPPTRSSSMIVLVDWHGPTSVWGMETRSHPLSASI